VDIDLYKSSVLALAYLGPVCFSFFLRSFFEKLTVEKADCVEK
jgi:23S rRNA maturation mini-RNase III